ncbi:hypothetical protein K440DRAFT_365942 [Wilcoxina mikolae CBS 423.85]|nr:hypothetical protein K440DRAFT_365942 [Wilcoxina mikolae CBS 423.85]
MWLDRVVLPYNPSSLLSLCSVIVWIYCCFSATCDGALGCLLSCGFPPLSVSSVGFLCAFFLVSLVSGVSSFTPFFSFNARDWNIKPALEETYFCVSFVLAAAFPCYIRLPFFFFICSWNRTEGGVGATDGVILAAGDFLLLLLLVFARRST